MKFTMAPMEGVTGYIYRNACQEWFGDADEYMAPFLSNRELTPKERKDILPDNNTTLRLIPQILTNQTEYFLQTAKMLQDYGYTEVNLNLGCPSGTVVAKGRGAGMLKDPASLQAFLEQIFESSPLPISLKTRVGMEDPREWPVLLDIYNQYPVKELIVHPRLRRQMYKGVPDLECFEQAVKEAKARLCYNGDITSRESFGQIRERFPEISSFMLGRGLIARPWLIRELKTGMPVPEEEIRKRMCGFHQTLLTAYADYMDGDRNVLFKMKEIWCYLGETFIGVDKELKRIRKTNSLMEYRQAAEVILRDKEIVK